MERKFKHYVGVDVGSKDFAVTLIHSEDSEKSAYTEIENSLKGFSKLNSWFKKSGFKKEESLICMENTGVYGTKFCYNFHEIGYHLVVEDAYRIKKASEGRTKNDKVDSGKIAIYAKRFVDRLLEWQPKSILLKEMQTLSTIRRLLIKERTALKNTLKSIEREQYRFENMENMIEKNIESLTEQVEEIDKIIKGLIESNSEIANYYSLLTSIPGIGFVSAVFFIVLTEGFTRFKNYKQLASYLGICPHEYRSGTSIYRRPRSSKRGPGAGRALMYLAGMSASHGKSNLAYYYLRKVGEGKNKRLVINNIANKQLRIMMAIIKSGVRFTNNYKSVNPMLLKA
ncbi:IS110 family transposase [bacterium]|nr:IS110 family transposase [bacterium]